MVRYSLTSTSKHTVVIDGLGVFQHGTTEIGEEAVNMFKLTRGMPLLTARLPEGVKISADISNEKTEGE
jgi:hypothetical protein